MKKLIVCSALAAFALSTQAASAAEFYIVRDTTTKKCTVVDTKPTTTTTKPVVLCPNGPDKGKPAPGGDISKCRKDLPDTRPPSE